MAAGTNLGHGDFALPYQRDLSSLLPHATVAGGGTGAETPRNNANHARRKQLLNLLDALNELNSDQGALVDNGITQQPGFESDRDVPTVDEHLQVIGAEQFMQFEKRINKLDKELRNFTNASRQLGSSIGILSSALNLRDRLAQVLFLFRENAADLFPRKVAREERETVIHSGQSKRPKRGLKVVAKPVVYSNLDPEDFPLQIRSLSVDVTTFLNCLNEFPEFDDEAVNSSIQTFERDLEYWAECLQAYAGQLRYPSVQRYVHDLTSEMGEHLDNITSTLSMFIENGVPTIRFAQRHSATNLLNLSTVATFFSAVTATTLQMSFNLAGHPLEDSVNSFYFASLVFSIAAAVNSLLGLTWKQAMYRSPGHRTPWWVLIWIKRSPLVFLVMSVACFSVGLVLFAWSSGQSRVTAIVTTIFTVFTSFGLAAVSAWFASERWAYTQHRGQKWLDDVISETKSQILRLPGVSTLHRAWKWSSHRLDRLRSHMSSFSVNLLTGSEEKVDSNASIHSGIVGAPHAAASPEPMTPSVTQAPPSTHLESIREPQSPEMRSPKSPLLSVKISEPDGITTDSPSASPARARFASAVRNIMKLQSSAKTFDGIGPRGVTRKRTASSGILEPSSKISGKVINGSYEPSAMPKSSRVAALVPKLKSMEASQDIAAHQALVRHLQFSPDGKFLATSSWDRTSVIFRVGDPCTSHRVLAHPQGFVGQVAWSPGGDFLLTKMNRGMKLWNTDGVCRKTIDRSTSVHSIAWLPGGEAFLSVEGSDIVKLDLNGNVLACYHFDNMILHDVAITPTSDRLLTVGELTSTRTGLVPSKSRPEKRLILYNIETQCTESQVPVLNDVRDITLARNGLVALVSYEDKAPPQLWNLVHVRVTDTMRLTLRHTYMPRFTVDFAGPSYFGGKDDQLVLCAAKAGDIHIWDRESGALLHHVRAQALAGDLTCIAWNHASDLPFMFATGSHDGAVRIWTSPLQDSESRYPRALTPVQSIHSDPASPRSVTPLGNRSPKDARTPNGGLTPIGGHTPIGGRTPEERPRQLPNSPPVLDLNGGHHVESPTASTDPHRDDPSLLEGHNLHSPSPGLLAPPHHIQSAPQHSTT